MKQLLTTVTLVRVCATGAHTPVRAQQTREPVACPVEDRLQEPLPDPDLYCIDLLPTGELDAFGSARLTPPVTPFTVAVAADGHQVYNVAFRISGLPDPHQFGGAQYVAW